jgi:hypothetical protein
VEVTLLQIQRGEKAAAQVRSQGITDKLPPDGYEYVLACVRIGYFRRVRGLEDEPYILAEGQLAAISSDGVTEYIAPTAVQQPQPALIGLTFNPGDIREGWVLLQVPREDKNPLLVYKRKHIEGAYGIWGYIWFKLY